MKRCIFYLPYKLEQNGERARMLRPKKMIQAFQKIGYRVYVIQGYAKERKARIHRLRTYINQGYKFDFMYSESSTMPTLLTEPHHYPLHPLFDFNFFNYVKKHGIRIGLFYCDIYWKFNLYGKTLPGWKKFFSLRNYKYDIWQYKRLLDRFNVADMKVCDYLGEELLTRIARELPPGAENLTINEKGDKKRDFSDKPLSIFYVGGIGNTYQIVEVVRAVSQTDNCELTICCRKEEWNKEKAAFEGLINERIHIVHKNSSELEEFYNKADLCTLMFQWHRYCVMAKPFKAYEYLAHEIPVLSTQGMAIGDFVEKNNIGWSIGYDVREITKVLKDILENPYLLEEKRKNCARVKKDNLWISRARTVAEDLTS